MAVRSFFSRFRTNVRTSVPRALIGLEHFRPVATRLRGRDCFSQSADIKTHDLRHSAIGFKSDDNCVVIKQVVSDKGPCFSGFPPSECFRIGANAADLLRRFFHVASEIYRQRSCVSICRWCIATMRKEGCRFTFEAANKKARRFASTACDRRNGCGRNVDICLVGEVRFCGLDRPVLRRAVRACRGVTQSLIVTGQPVSIRFDCCTLATVCHSRARQHGQRNNQSFHRNPSVLRTTRQYRVRLRECQPLRATSHFEEFAAYRASALARIAAVTGGHGLCCKAPHRILTRGHSGPFGPKARGRVARRVAPLSSLLDCGRHHAGVARIFPTVRGEAS